MGGTSQRDRSCHVQTYAGFVARTPNLKTNGNGVLRISGALGPRELILCLRHCCSGHTQGTLSTGASGGRCAAAHAIRDGRRVHALCPAPPRVGEGGDDDDNGEEASQRSGAAPAPTGRSGSPRRGHGRAQGANKKRSISGSPFKGLGSPVKGLGSAFKGLGSPFKGLGSSVKGLGSAFKGLGSPFKGSSTPPPPPGTPGGKRTRTAQHSAQPRPFLKDPLGERRGGCSGPWPAPADPPEPHHKNCPAAKNEIYQRGRKFEANFRYTNFLFGLCPPPHPHPRGGGGCPAWHSPPPSHRETSGPHVEPGGTSRYRRPYQTRPPPPPALGPSLQQL